MSKTIPKMIRCLGWLLLTGGLFGANSWAQDDSAVAADSQESAPRPASSLLRLQSTFIGDKEQPSVSYFIPWQGNDAPDDLKWNIERKNDDTLGRVDRDIMLRSINIYDEMELEK